MIDQKDEKNKEEKINKVNKNITKEKKKKEEITEKKAKDTENKEESKKNAIKLIEEKTVEEDTSNKKIENKKESKLKKKKGLKITIILIIILAMLAMFFSTIFSLLNMNSNKIMSGISIMEIEVSGLTVEEATAKLTTIYNEKMDKYIDVVYDTYSSILNPELLEVEYNIEKAVQEAYSVGRSDNIFNNNFEIANALINKIDINVEMELNEEVLAKNIVDIGVNLPGITVETTYTVSDEELIITRGVDGIQIDSEEMTLKVKEVLNDLYISSQLIEIPVTVVSPKDIDIDTIYSEVYKEAQDAYIVEEPFELSTEVSGVTFDLEAARTLINSEYKEIYNIQLEIINPAITISDLGAEAFPDQLSTYTTRYDASLTNRTTNLQLAVNAINEVVLLPGEIFSYNQTLGPRTVEAGYKNASIYYAGSVVDGIGGGICQISTTLYNAALMSGLNIVERQNHQFTTSYAAAGRDATVYYGVTDFQFENTRDYPIKIVASLNSGIATVSIYGIATDTEYTYSFSSKVIATIPYTVQYEEDSTVAVGTETVTQNGVNGQKVETYMTKSLDGVVVETVLLSTDTYNAMNKIIVRGTKDVVETVVTPEVSSPQETESVQDVPDSSSEGVSNSTENTE